jgi:protein gp37
VIAGGESGFHARPMNPEWTRALRDECLGASIAFHFKQWGNWSPVEDPVSARRVKTLFLSNGDKISVANFGKAKAGRVLDGATWDQFPGAVPV